MRVRRIRPDVRVTKPTAKNRNRRYETDQTYTKAEREKTNDSGKTSYQMDPGAIARLEAEAEKNNASLRQLTKELFEKQMVRLASVQSNSTNEETDLVAKTTKNDLGNLTSEKVSKNIVTFAIQISGSDKRKLPLLKELIDTGVQEATNKFGDSFPKSAQETYQLVMEKLDAWVNDR